MRKVISKISADVLFDQLEIKFNLLIPLINKNTRDFVVKFDIRNPNPDSLNQVLACLVDTLPHELSNKENESQVQSLLLEIQALDRQLF
jgi:hypothetical protein